MSDSYISLGTSDFADNNLIQFGSGDDWLYTIIVTLIVICILMIIATGIYRYWVKPAEVQ
jgi:hypothetical protein